MRLDTLVMTAADALGLTSAPTEEAIGRRRNLARDRLRAWYWSGPRPDARGKEVDEAIAATARSLDPEFPESVTRQDWRDDLYLDHLADRIAEHMTGQGRGRLLDPPIITL